MAVHLVLNTQHAPVYGEELEPQCSDAAMILTCPHSTLTHLPSLASVQCFLSQYKDENHPAVQARNIGVILSCLLVLFIKLLLRCS